MDFEAVIGLEIHIELNCKTKMFCDCPNRPGDDPNFNTCPTCLWLPGAIPRFSAEALEKASLLCLGLGAELQPQSAFDQKVYYYPDLPKGYQLSQAHRPLSRGGGIDITDEDGNLKRLRIHHIHMEEDVAKLVHELEGRVPISLVDFNRAGAPLVEIVTEPDFRTPHHAMEFLKALRTQVRYVGSSECSMENGTMRGDANISVRPRGSAEMNTKVEIKRLTAEAGEIEKFKQQKQELERKLDVIRELNAQKTGPVEMLDELSLIIPEKAWLSSITNKGATIVLEGSAVDNTTIATFMKQLQASKHFDNVTLVLSKQESGAQKFSIPCKIKLTT